MHTLQRLLLPATIVILIAACSTSPTPAVGPSAVPSTGPTGSPSALAVSPAPSDAPPSAEPSAKPSPRPSASPAPPLSAAERRLVDQLRVDVRVSCVPRRTDLPPNANAGVECHETGALVDRVGIYSFKEALEFDGPLQAYLERLAANHVQPRTGDCRTGTSGDSAWPDYLPDVGDDGNPEGYSGLRSGCFLDENGMANVRLTCYGGLYMGILGRTADVPALYEWAWRIAKGESTHRDPPGICAAPD